MKRIFNRRIAALFLVFCFISVGYSNCSNSGFSSLANVGSATSAAAGVGGTSTNPYLNQNALTLTVGCFADGYNQPCVNVTICLPGTTTCQTITNVLVDTGSSGLRVFSKSLNATMLAGLQNSTSTGECYAYLDGSYDWGGIVNADVHLGGETAPSVPMQVINQSFGDGGTACVAALKAQGMSPTFDDSSYNGIMGVSFLSQDCGSDCVSYSDNQVYFKCTGTSCASGAVALASQVVNPVALMPFDNNGVVLQLPSVSGGVASYIQGTMYLGVGTQANNTPVSSVATLSAISDTGNSCYTEFTTSWGGSTMCGFIDSGSTALTFPNISYAVDSYGNYNPTATVTASATNIGANGVQSTVSFSFASVDNISANDLVLGYWGVNSSAFSSTKFFDWGLPFFLSRTVYVGLEGKTSTLDSGSYGGLYWAY